LKQKEYIGFESIEILSEILSKLSVKRILLITGRESYSSCGAENYLSQILSNYEAVRFFDFSNNPKNEDVKKGIELFGQIKPDAVIAVGGGSVLDIAKLVNFFAANNLELREYFEAAKSELRKPKPLIAIPTTAGSGSEATSFAVLYVDKEKISIDNKCILPDVAIVDPGLTMSLPKYTTAVTGMDALCQAIESYWSINSNDESKSFAGDAIELIMANLDASVNNPTKASRFAMAKAANLAGKAINITRTTAPHAISYPLTSYFDIPHGHAVVLTMPAMFEYNVAVDDKDVLDSRGADYVRYMLSEIAAILGAKDICDGGKMIKELMHKIGLETSLSRLGVSSQEDIEMIIINGFNPERAANNPRKLTKQALKSMLERIL
jgi:alcohol dehydrogenase class IV